MHALLADLVLAFHVAYVLFVVVGEFVILAGGLARAGWVRNPWFRFLHLAAIGIVAAEAMAGVECPLTRWERQLRYLAGQTPSEVSFVARLLREIIFVDVSASVLAAAHVAFALLVLATLVLVPPRWPGQPAHSAR